MGGENFRFAVQTRTREGPETSTRFLPPRHQQFPVETRWKNGARIRITRQTTAQLKLRSRDQRKRNVTKKKKKGREKREFRVPSLYLVTWERELKNFFFAETTFVPPPLLHARTCNTSPPLCPFFFRRNAHTHFPNTSFTHIYKEWYTYVGRKRRRVDRCWSVLDWGSQATSQPASRLADQPTIPHSIRRFSLSLPCERNEVSPGVLSPGNIVWQGPPRDNISDVC